MCIYHFNTSDQRKASAYISHIAVAQNVNEIYALSQCVYLINSRHCTPDRNAHYIQKSLDFFDVILYFSFLTYGIKQAVIVGLNFAKQTVIVGFNFNTSTVVCFLLL